eukprot:scaffold23176_cov21-Tisochrysis_lutea.AAC.1
MGEGRSKGRPGPVEAKPRGGAAGSGHPAKGPGAKEEQKAAALLSVFQTRPLPEDSPLRDPSLKVHMPRMTPCRKGRTSSG